MSPFIIIIGILQIFIFGHLLLNGGGVYLYMCEACLELTHCMSEVAPCYALFLLGHEGLVDAVLFSPIFFRIQIHEVS